MGLLFSFALHSCAMLILFLYQRHHHCRYLCEACFATTIGVLKYTDFRANAPYSLTSVSTECYLATTKVEHRTPWALLKDWSLPLSRDDPQHVLYNKGVASDLIAGCLKNLMADGRFGGRDQDEQSSEAYQDFMVDPSSKVHDPHTPKPFTVRRFGFNLNTPTVACGYKHGQVRAMVHWLAKVRSTQDYTFGGIEICSCGCVVPFYPSVGLGTADADRRSAARIGCFRSTFFRRI